jgi:hypothetical protein
MFGPQTTPFGVQTVRPGLSKMTDEELLRFGQAAKFVCRPSQNSGGPPREEFVIQLQEARAEWRRRFSKEPLRDSI